MQKAYNSYIINTTFWDLINQVGNYEFITITNEQMLLTSCATK